MVEHGPQLTDRVMEAGPRGPFGNAQGLRDLRERIAQVVVQDDDRPLLRCQPAEGAFELVPGDDGARHVRFERGVGGNDPDAGDPASLGPGLGVARVDDEAVEPGVEALGVAKGG